MRTLCQNLLFLAMLAFVGCNRSQHQGVPSGYSKQSGDIGKFFVAEVQRYGGNLRTTNALPKLQMEWWYKADGNGFQLLLDKTNHVEFQDFLQEAFGNPKLNADYPHVLYKVQDIGAAIMCNFGTNPLHVICLKAQAF